MDFSFTEEQLAVGESATAIFSGMASSERVAAIEATDDRIDGELWSALARANLLGLAIPDELGGSGLGLVELCLVLEAQGRTVAPIPLWATTVLGSMPITHFGTDEQRQRFLPGVASGEIKLTAALADVATDATHPAAVSASRSNRGWQLQGVAHAVPQAHLASRVLVPASADGQLAVFLVDPNASGVKRERVVTTDRQVHPHLRFEGATVEDADVLAEPGQGSPLVDWTLERARIGLCAIGLGVCEEAVKRAAAFLNERHQFGRPLSSFQGTMLRAADAFIDTEAIRVTMWNAAWRLDTDRPATEAVAAAHWWASEAGQRVVHATQHLHGGIGADIEYPIHRYFLWGKQIELMLGAPNSELARLGAALASAARSGSHLSPVPAGG